MQQDRKKEHKRILKFMHKLNKQIGSDEYLGLNRFRLDMYRENWYRFEDNSGGILSLMIKISDNETGNYAVFMTDNYAFIRDVENYANDFLIRSSSGYEGHYPPLHYIIYDVHKIVPYAGDQRKTNFSDEAIGCFDYIH